MNFDVTINTDDNYIQHAMAMLDSLYENNRDHSITVHVLQKNLSEQSKEFLNVLSKRYDNKVLFYDVDESKLEGVQFRKNRPLSMAAYYRLLLSSVLPKEIDRVLYLDCDMIVLKDVSEVFSIELDDYALAASLDHFPYDHQHRLQLHMDVGERTFCSGVMLVNLKYWRLHNVEDGLLEYAKRHRKTVYLHDQDVLNYFFKKKWFLLPPKWNRVACDVNTVKCNDYKAFDYYEYRYDPMIIHYADLGIKPWLNFATPNRKYYLKYLKNSTFEPVSFQRGSFALRLKAYKAIVTNFWGLVFSPYVPQIFKIVTNDIKVLLLFCVDRKKAFEKRFN